MGVRQARVVVGAVCALVLACVDALDASAPRPHFVFILQDDLGEFAVFVVFETHALSRIAACWPNCCSETLHAFELVHS